jgi:hypothetical protein
VFDGSTHEHLSVRERAGRSERQWKGVLSWMLGVAGTRHVLAREGYRWIAPLSAFYPELVTPVDLTAWHTDFGPGRLVARRPRASRSRLRPDYLAVRESGTPKCLEWAIVESKGTSASLTGKVTCPRNWSTQVRNIEILIDGHVQKIARHIVIATRVNPNAKWPRTRRLQIRAWNSQALEPYNSSSEDAAAEIAAAHLFGLFRNLGLVANARALAASVQARRESRGPQSERRMSAQLIELQQIADEELVLRGRYVPRADDQSKSLWIDTEIENEKISVELDAPTVTLAHELMRANDPGKAAAALIIANERLDEMPTRPVSPDTHPAISFPAGVTIHLLGRRTLPDL